jgi:hypothetical protein
VGASMGRNGRKEEQGKAAGDGVDFHKWCGLVDGS